MSAAVYQQRGRAGAAEIRLSQLVERHHRRLRACAHALATLRSRARAHTGAGYGLARSESEGHLEVVEDDGRTIAQDVDVELDARRA